MRNLLPNSLLKGMALAVLGIVIFSVNVFAQNSVGIGTTTPNIKSILELTSNNQGFLVPRMDDAGMVSIGAFGAADDGMMIYNFSQGQFMYYDAALDSWEPVGGGGADNDWVENADTIYNDLNYVVVGQQQAIDYIRMLVVNNGTRTALAGSSDGDGARAIGVEGFATGNNDFNMGVVGIGEATTASDTAVGVYGSAENVQGLGAGVRGEAVSTAAGTHLIGGSFEARDDAGNGNVTGVEAIGDGTGVADTVIGLRGAAFGGTENWAGYFESGDVYVNDNVGIRVANPLAPLHVNGEAIIGNAGLVCGAGTAGAMRYNGGTGEIEYCDGAAWQSMGGAGARIVDADGDTEIDVENSADEDIIHFNLGNSTGYTAAEYFRMTGPRLGVLNSGGSVFLGQSAGANDDLSSNYNVFVGQQSGQDNTTGDFNVAMGYVSLWNNTTGRLNTAIGNNSMYSNAIGSYNSALGANALWNNTTGNYNVANGHNSLYNNTSGGNNVASGYQALYSNTTGFGNVANGPSALYSNTTANYNIASGYQSLYSNTTGAQNVSHGFYALRNNVTGSYNTANGENTLYSNVAGSNATALGARAMYYANNTTTPFTNYNVAVGYEALRGSTTASANTGNYNTALGYQTLYGNSSGIQNTATGYQALFDNTTGQQNTATGYLALTNNSTGNYNASNGVRSMYANTSGSFNSGFGFCSLYSNTMGQNNTANGAYAMYRNTTGNYNVALGRDALYNNVAGNYGVAIGYRSMYYANNTATGFSNTNIALGYEALRGSTTASANTGANNTVTGYQAMRSNSSGGNNSAYGYRSMYSNTTGVQNVALGFNSLYSNTIQSSNTAIGYNALSNAAGYNNTALGFQAGWNMTAGSNNTAIGYQSLSATTASYNVGLGFNAGNGNTSGTNNTFIGRDADASDGTITNATAIGANAVVGVSNRVKLGNGADVEFDRALMPAGDAGTLGQLLVSQGGGAAPQWQDASAASANIYSTNGSLGAMRTVTFDANDLNFNLNSTGDFRVYDVSASNTRFVVEDNGEVGVRIQNPEAPLHVRANGGGIKMKIGDDNQPNYDWNISVDGLGDYLFSNENNGTQTNVMFADASTGNVGFGGTTTISQKVDIENTGVWSLGGSALGADNLFLKNLSATDGLNAIGGSVSFSGAGHGGTAGANRRHAAIAGIQTDTDNDQVGLAFFTHNATSSTANMQESMRLTHDGNLQIAGDSYSYTSAKTNYYSMSAHDFELRDQNSFGRSGTTTGNETHVSGGSTGGAAYYFAPVHVPNGATITNVEIFHRNNDGTYNMTFELVRFDMASNVVADIGVGASTTTSSGLGSVNWNTSTVVDNSRYSYYIEALTRQNNSNNWIRGAIITYTVNQAD